MGAHIVNGKFQSDKYPSCPAGKVPLSTSDPTAWDLLWEYAQRRRAVDPEFSADLETCLLAAGYVPPFPRRTLAIPPAAAFCDHAEMVEHQPGCGHLACPCGFTWDDGCAGVRSCSRA